MKFKDNENGYALLMVIMLVLLFTTLGMGLLAMNINASKQFSNKEEQVQARHFAEMGVLHYKAEVESIVEKNKKEKDLSCTDFPKVLSKNSDENIEVEVYEVVINPLKCDDSLENKVKIVIDSTGKVERNEKEIVVKKIEAEINIFNSAKNNGDNENNEGEELSPIISNLPVKPRYPEKLITVNDLDSIHGNAAKVRDGKSDDLDFETGAFIEILGALNNIQKNSNWTFKNHLLVSGELKLDTAGNNSAVLTVDKDLYIAGDLTISNHAEVIPNNNLIVLGDVFLANQLTFNIKGNALFKGGNFTMKPNANLLINKNAYFRNEISSVHKKSDICVRGEAYLWSSEYGAWKLYKETENNNTYQYFDKKCFGNWEGEPASNNWEVQPELTAIYIKTQP